MGITCRVTPRGDITIDGEAVSEADRRVAAAFAEGTGQGLLQLGAAEVRSDVDATLAFFRELAKAFVAAVCGAIDPYAPDEVVIPAPDAATLGGLVTAVPPMRGAELVDRALLEALWERLGEALPGKASAHPSVQAYLRAQSDAWNVVGRVTFHIAENAGDTAFPFAFIATYTRALSRRSAAPIYVPLATALQEYAGAGNKQQLVSLLAPLERAAEESELMRGLVDSGDVYHPLAWTAEDAHGFLRETPALERAGLVVRTPAFWNAAKPPRPRVTIAVGTRAPSQLGMAALLDFDVDVTLDGDKLSKADVAKLLAARNGLVLVRGRWVEVDGESLGAVLEHWQEAAAQATAGGMTMAEAMRLVAGANIGAADAVDVDDRAAWSEVVAGKWLDKRLASLDAPRIRAAVERSAGLRAELRPYQKQGVAWLSTLAGLGLGGCLADDMGLGKTIQVIGLMSLQKKSGRGGTDLLVVPASLVHNWHAEIERFAPRLSVLVAHPSVTPRSALKKLTNAELEAHDVVITTYGSATRYPVLSAFAWRSVILDEAQAIKNPAAKQTRAIKSLKSAWRLALTGTPVENRLGDLWSIFDFLNPGLLGGRKAFNAFCKRMTKRGGYAPLRNVVKPYILRRLKTDKRVIADLPDKIEITTHCLLSKKQAALYQESVEELRTILAEVEGIKRRGVVLSFLMRFKQICNHPSQWLGDETFEAADSGKLARLRELCEPIAARQDKALVFTQFREMTAPLVEHLGEMMGSRGLVLHGGTPVNKRKDLVEAFQQDDDIGFMVLSLKAGGTGLNLTAASHVIHFDRWWNPAVEDQATDRAFRIGQKNNVMVHKLVCLGTVEERIDELIRDKRKVATDVLEGGAESSLTEMSNDELLALVSLDVHSAMGA